MKIVLALSLGLNLLLSGWLFFKKTADDGSVPERLVIQDFPEATPQQVLGNNSPAIKNPSAQNEKDPPKQLDLTVLAPSDPVEVQEAGERMETDRQEFMLQKLRVTEKKLSKHNELREDFFKRTSAFWQKNPMRELSFEDRRKLIEIEEDYHRSLEKLYGRKNFERYQKFREAYNQKGFKRQMEDNRPFLFMGL
jgi:hypothetical protein